MDLGCLFVCEFGEEVGVLVGFVFGLGVVGVEGVEEVVVWVEGYVSWLFFKDVKREY